LTEKIKQKGSLGSVAEDLFVELFCDTFGPDQAEYLFLQYPVTDIYGHRRSIDFALESEDLCEEDKLLWRFERIYKPLRPRYQGSWNANEYVERLLLERPDSRYVGKSVDKKKWKKLSKTREN